MAVVVAFIALIFVGLIREVKRAPTECENCGTLVKKGEEVCPICHKQMS